MSKQTGRFIIIHFLGTMSGIGLSILMICLKLREHPGMIHIAVSGLLTFIAGSIASAAVIRDYNDPG